MKRQSEDVIQRQSLFRHWTREARELTGNLSRAKSTADRLMIRGRLQQIDANRAWLKLAANRASDPGGIGKR